MRRVNWATFDLNLLVVFDAVMRERSVTRAGQRIGLSQPAMSHALNRLRYLLKDELFVRTPDGMVPTARAEQLAPPLSDALRDMHLALEPDTFVPEEATRRFVVAVNNYASVVVVPDLVMAASRAAPGVRLVVRPCGTLNVPDLLDRGELDLAIGNFPSPGDRFTSMLLLEDPFVLATRSGHPSGNEELTAASLAALRYFEISSSGEDTSFVDEFLAEHGLERKVHHRAPHLATACILYHTDMVAVLSRRTAEAFTRDEGLALRELPCPTPKVPTCMLWHRRLENQPAHRWLRELVQSVVAEL
jgi:DNA-binding transcriptional LysR family regulator